MSNTYIPDWNRYIKTDLPARAQLAPGDFLTIEDNGWITGSWGRRRCTGCIIEDPEDNEKVIVWETDPNTKVKYDPSDTDYRPECFIFYIKYNDVQIYFKKI